MIHAVIHYFGTMLLDQWKYLYLTTYWKQRWEKQSQTWFLLAWLLGRGSRSCLHVIVDLTSGFRALTLPKGQVDRSIPQYLTTSKGYCMRPWWNVTLKWNAELKRFLIEFSRHARVSYRFEVMTWSLEAMFRNHWAITQYEISAYYVEI